MKKTLAFLMAFLTTFTALSFSACNGAGTSDANTGTEQVEVPEKQPESNITATIVRPNETYGFCSEIAFLGSDLAATSENGYEAVSAELVATVEPIDANQNVDWSVAFVNPSSTWASGKTVSDYVTVTTETAGSTTATVTCKAPFGEQIVITCTSQENADISAECTVDFVQTVQSVSLTFGDDLPINLGGETGIEWEMNPNGIGKGGAANVNVAKYDTYTIATDAYSWEIDLISPDYYYNGVDDETWGTVIGEKDSNNTTQYATDKSHEDGYLKLTYMDYGLNRLNDIKDLIFNSEFAFTEDRATSPPFVFSRIGVSGLSYMYESTVSGNLLCGAFNFDYYQEDGKTVIDTNGSYVVDYSNPIHGDIEEGSMWTLRLKMNNGMDSKEYKSLLKLTNIVSNPLVQSVSFANSALKF